MPRVNDDALACQTEIEDFDPQFLGRFQPDIAGFYVPMNDVLNMQIGECAEKLL